MDTGKRFSGYFLFKKLSEEPFGEAFRAGRLLGNVVDRLAHLQLFNGPNLEPESFWELVGSRGTLHKTISDPHIADGIELGISDGVPFAAYEYCPGKTLSQFLREAESQEFPIPTDQALFILERIALALTAAYRTRFLGRSVVHGFLIPELVRLSDEGQVHLMGFASAPGLRSQLAARGPYRSYIAPEVRSWDPAVETDDVFSLGAILFQLITGKRLPEEPKAPWDSLIEESILATGEPIPEAIRHLLLHSFAAREHRIPTAATWQRLLSKLILDGDYNPTTFNLAFLIHTLFREELERERHQFEKARRFRLDPSLPAQEVDLSPRETATEKPADTPAPVPVTPVEVDHGHRSFFIGLTTSLLVASLLMSGYFLLRRPGEARVEEPGPGSANTAPLSSSFADDSVERRTASDVPVVETEEPESPDAEANATENEIQLLVEQRTQALENTLRAEYDRQLKILREQLEEARRAAATRNLRKKAAESNPATSSPLPSEPQPRQREASTEPRRPEREMPENHEDATDRLPPAREQAELVGTADSTPPGSAPARPIEGEGTASEDGAPFQP